MSSPTKKSTGPDIQNFISDLISAGLTGTEAMACAKSLWLAGLSSKGSLKNLQSWDPVRFEQINIDETLAKKLVSIGGGKKGTKRKRRTDMDQPVPTEAAKDLIKQSLVFEEQLEDFALQSKTVLVNRAPVMTAWAMVVAECLGFNRQEALSIAQAFTALNATSKGQSLGILPTTPVKDASGSSQPFVELMGRKVPVLSLQNEEWRGIIKGKICEPESAFGYIKRSLQQHAGATIGAMRLLASAFTAMELNEKGYGLYCEFRPSGSGWGQKTEMPLRQIVGLRPVSAQSREDEQSPMQRESEHPTPPLARTLSTPPHKRPKAEADDEFDELDIDIDFEALDLP